MPSDFDWTQEKELNFISELGKPEAFTSHTFRIHPKSYAERIVRGYIESLSKRAQWFSDVDVPKLRTAAERRLQEITKVPGAPN